MYLILNYFSMGRIMPKNSYERKMHMLYTHCRTAAVLFCMSLLWLQTNAIMLKSEINERNNEMKNKENQPPSAEQPNRPQTPQGPFTYKQEDVCFENKAAQIILAGTLTLPQGKGPFPTVILIAGMGPNDRDYGMFGHKVFLVIADYLTQRGIAVLRYDKRGVGKSTGVYKASLTSQDFADDVKVAIDYLKTRADVDQQKIGLLGHSEGGMIAQMVAAQSKDVAFIVLLASAGLLVDLESIVEQTACQLRADGASEKMITEDKKIRKQLLEVVKQEVDCDAVAKRMHEQLQVYWANLPELLQAEAEKLPFALTASKANQLVGMFNSPWYRFFLNYVPVDTLNLIKIPVLALNGDCDFITSCKNLQVIAHVFNENGNNDYTIFELPKMNHWFQECQTGALVEYSALEQTISPKVLDIITEWILERAR